MKRGLMKCVTGHDWLERCAAIGLADTAGAIFLGH